MDDVFVIVLFSTFVSMARGGSAKILDFVEIPIEIILGIVLSSKVQKIKESKNKKKVRKTPNF